MGEEREIWNREGRTVEVIALGPLSSRTVVVISEEGDEARRRREGDGQGDGESARRRRRNPFFFLESRNEIKGNVFFNHKIVKGMLLTSSLGRRDKPPVTSSQGRRENPFIIKKINNK